jgi:hypothetical protein
MGWGKMDDKFHRNRKVRELRRAKGGREALGTWVFWWSWVLDDPELTGIVPSYELDDAEAKSAEMLVSAGLWDRIEGGFRFHDFHDYNPTRSQLDAKREADRTRVAGKRGASRTKVACDTSATSDEQECDSEATNPRVASTRDPVPSRPDPSESATHSLGTRGLLVTRFQRAWEAQTHSAWGGTAGAVEWDTAVKVIDRTAKLRSCEPNALIQSALVAWLADTWAIENDFPPIHFARNIARYFPAVEAGAATTVSSPLEAAWQEAQQAAHRALLAGADPATLHRLEQAEEAALASLRASRRKSA